MHLIVKQKNLLERTLKFQFFLKVLVFLHYYMVSSQKPRHISFLTIRGQRVFINPLRLPCNGRIRYPKYNFWAPKISTKIILRPVEIVFSSFFLPYLMIYQSRVFYIFVRGFTKMFSNLSYTYHLNKRSVS